jgi:hypothetical protein
MNDSQLVKRLKSLAWRAGVMAAIVFVNAFVEGAAGLGLPTWSIILIGLVGGEVTKYLNTKTS